MWTCVYILQSARTERLIELGGLPWSEATPRFPHHSPLRNGFLPREWFVKPLVESAAFYSLPGLFWFWSSPLFVNRPVRQFSARAPTDD